MSRSPHRARLAAGLVRDARGTARGWWPGEDPLYVRYLSWLTLLRKRPHFREAFAGFDVADRRLALRPPAGSVELVAHLDWRRPPPRHDVNVLIKRRLP